MTLKLPRSFAAAFTGVALIATLPACAQTQTLPAPVAETKVPAAEMELAEEVSQGPALWKVSDEDTTIYLFGTVHALPTDVEWYGETISTALESSDTIVTEIKLDEGSQAQMQQVVMSQGLLPPETTLRALLDEEQTAQYEAALTKIGMPAGAFDRFEPWLAGLTLTTLPLLQQGYSTESGVDKVIVRKAPDKANEALETIEFQIGIFDGLPQASQIEFMMEAANGVEEVKPFLDRMVAEWIEGDADALAELMNEGLNDPEVAEQLLYARNRNWAEWIDTRLDAPGTVFMAVGAGHLAGEKSVQDYLAERDIETARVQ